MLSVLAQRTAFRLPALSGSLLLRSHATPIVLKPVVTRTFGSTSLLAFPKTATKVTTKTTATTKSTAKKTPAKAASKTRKIAAKKPVKKKVKKVVKKVDKPKKPKAVKKPAKVVILPEHKPPKAAASSYALFFTQYFKQHNPGTTTMQDNQAIAKRAGAAWHGMTEEEKRPFVEQREADHKRYLERRAEYIANVPDDVRKELNRQRKKLGKPLIFRPQPPRSMSAYFRFLMGEFRPKYVEQNPGASSTDIARAAGAAWRALPDAEKKVYVDAYLKGKAELAEKAAAA